MNDKFIRTNEARGNRSAYFRASRKGIFILAIEGWYCTHEETFLLIR